MRKTFREIRIYLYTTFIATWAIWLWPLLFLNYGMQLPVPYEWIIRIGSFIPSLIGIIFAYAYGKSPEIKVIFKSVINYKFKFKWYLYIFLTFPIIILLSYLILNITHEYIPKSEIPIWFIPIAFVYIMIFMGPLGEELGWRGFVLKRMLKVWSPLKSGLFLGIIWSIWHVPLFFIPATIQNQLAKNGVIIVIFGYFIYTTLISLLITLVFINTNYSLLSVILFHTMSNLCLGIVPIIMIKRGALIILLILFIATYLILYKNKWNFLENPN